MLPKYLSALTTYAASGNRGLAYLSRRITSPLYVNSYYLMAATVASSGIGFVFWMLAARSTKAADIGIATAAIASVNLLIALCELGLSTSLIHYASSDRGQTSALLNTIVASGWLGISLTTIGFLVGIPFWAPGLMPIRSDVMLILIFFTYTAFNYILGLQDAAMLSQRRANYVFWRNLACNIPSVLLVLPLLNRIGGYPSLFLAYSLPNILVGLITGLVVLPRFVRGYRFFGQINRGILARIASYGLANHVGNILWSLPAYLLPIMAINTLTPEETGYFVINWTIANFVLIAPRMVTYSLFAESSRSDKGLWQASLQSFLLILVFVAPVVTILWFWGDYILSLFGESYINLGLLRLLLLSILPFTINSIFLIILRSQRKLKEIILFSALLTGSILALAGIFVHLMSAEGLAMGWLVGHIFAAILVSGIILRKFLLTRSVRS